MPNTNDIFFAAVRVNSILSMGYLATQVDHAKRIGEGVEIRPGAIPGEALHRQFYGAAPCEYIEAFKAHKTASGARERAGARLGMHLLCSVSPAWLAATGDVHDRNNPRVSILFEAAIAFAERRIGGVFGARMDLDEAGAGVVDVFCAPVSDRVGRRRKDGTHGPSVPELSSRKSLKALKTEFGGKREYEAVQTAFAKDMQEIDPAIKRGISKKITGREHDDTPEFKAKKDKLATLEQEHSAKALEVESLEARAASAKAERVEAEKAVAAEREVITRERGDLEERRRSVEEAAARTATEKKRLEKKRLTEEAERQAEQGAAQRAQAEKMAADAALSRDREEALRRAWDALEEEHNADFEKRRETENRQREVEQVAHRLDLERQDLHRQRVDVATRATRVDEAMRRAEEIQRAALALKENAEAMRVDRDKAVLAVEDWRKEIVSLNLGLRKIGGGTLSASEIDSDAGLKPAAKILAFVLRAVERRVEAENASAAYRVREAERSARAAEEKAAAAEARAAQAEKKNRALVAAVLKFRSQGRALLDTMQGFKFPPDARVRLDAFRGVFVEFFGDRRETSTENRGRE